MLSWGAVRICLAIAATLCAAACADAPTLGPGVYCSAPSLYCPDPSYPTCDPVARMCVPAGTTVAQKCAADSECTDAARPLCDVELGACMPCYGAGGPARASVGDATCVVRSPSLPRCDPMTGRCAACRTETAAADCAAPLAPVCDHGACRACRSHDECASRVCLPEGNCGLEASVVYVDNVGGKCAGAAHAGTRADPYCDIPDGIAGAGQRSIVRVLGSTVAYHGVDTTTAPSPLVLLGEGRAVTPMSTITAAGAPCVNLTAMKVLTLDGLELTGCKNGVYGTGGQLVMRRSVVHDVSGVGVDLHGGDATHLLDGVVLRDNSGGGLGLHSANYDVRNCFIAHNPGGFGGVLLEGLVMSGRFAFNTVRDNRGNDSVGGISCGLAIGKAMIESSIVISNSLRSTRIVKAGTQFGDTCQLTNVVAGAGEMFPDATRLDPEFVNPSQVDYRLLPKSGAVNAGVIDAVASDPGNDHDIDGNHRPAGPGWDIGCYEAPAG
jgi:hypothetical protein